MGSKDHFLYDWVEYDLLLLSCVDTTMNMADHVTKQLGPTLFHRHIAYIMGHVPPQYTQLFQTLLGSVSIPILTTPRQCLLHLHQYGLYCGKSMPCMVPNNTPPH